MSDEETLAQLILYTINSGLGAAIKFIMDWLIRELKESGRDPSPRTRRWLTYGVCFVLPTVLYTAYILLTQMPYSLAGHALVVFSAFGVSQAVHGVQNLPTGAQVRAQEQAQAQGQAQEVEA